MAKDPSNIEAARTVMNIYYQLNENEKAEEMKAKIDEIQGSNSAATSGQ